MSENRNRSISRSRWRRDFIIPLSFFATLGFLAFALIQLDRQYYQYEKYKIIIANPKKYIPLDRARLKKMCERILTQPLESPDRSRALAELEKEAGELLQGPGPYFSFQLMGATEHAPPIIQIENPQKLRLHNRWSNSLFLKDFQRAMDEVYYRQDNLFIDDEDQRPPLGRFVLRYTTPLGSPEIEALTAQWRKKCLWITLGFIAVYAIILKGILLPVRRVISCLEGADLSAPIILRRPGSLLERAYNNLARDACLTKFAERLRDRAAENPALDTRQLLDVIPEDLRSYFGFSRVIFISLRAEEGGGPFWVLDRIHGTLDPQFTGLGDASLIGVLKRQAASYPPSEEGTEWTNRQIDFRDAAGRPVTAFASVIARREDPPSVVLVVFPPNDKHSPAPNPWEKDTYRQATAQIRVVLDNLTSQRRLIIQEKSKANISLTRNLGHDLTNIVATGKLDLLTMRRFLSLPPDAWVNQPEKAEIFRASLEAVLNNTRFLQEIVNIYRSFAFLSRPKFEWVDPRQIVNDVVELFRLSLSRSIRVETDFQENIPPCLVEPRLVKLALFNLLTNAADAIKVVPRETQHDDGRILITVAREEQSDEFRIAVADNGTGILDADGQPASPEEMERIFNLGFTTKANDHGEGLGLNWVHTIIHEFHGGRVVPRNRPEGGAELTMFLRIEGPRDNALSPLTPSPATLPPAALPPAGQPPAPLPYNSPNGSSSLARPEGQPAS